MPSDSSTRDRAVMLLATGLGLGRLPRAPGTFGTLLGLPLAWGLARLHPAAHYATLAALWFLAIAVCGAAARRLGQKDPGAVVLDEIVALPLLYVFVPLNVPTALAGFVLFRLFDILKPWPVRRLEHLPGGWGVLADDLAAAVYATAALWCIARWGLLY